MNYNKSYTHLLTNAKSLEHFACLKTQLHFVTIPHFCNEVQKIHLQGLHMYTTYLVKNIFQQIVHF